MKGAPLRAATDSANGDTSAEAVAVEAEQRPAEAKTASTASGNLGAEGSAAPVAR